MAGYAPFVWLSFLLLLLILLIFKKKKEVRRENKPLLPPSPPKLPILGNLHQLGELLHQSYCNLSKKYGPVMHLQLGQIPTVVISSAEAAREALKVHDLACSGRPLLAGSGRLSYNYLDVAFTSYGDYWKNLRKLVVLELFSLKRVQSFCFIREEEVELLINSISEFATSAAAVNLTEKLFALTANIVFKMSFGFEYRGTGFDRGRFHEVIHDAEAVAGSISKGEFFPFVGWIIDWITGHHARTERVFHELDTFFQHVINNHLKPGRKKKFDDMVDVLLRMEKEQTELGEADQFTKNNIKAVLMNLFIGGTDSAANTVNWTMAELVKDPRVMKKAQDEIRNVIGKKGRVTETDLNQFEYLKMVIKETLRLHPGSPLVTRESISHCKINNYDIYPKTLIQVNTWAIGRDPTYWNDPEKFFPERFAGSSIDFKGQNFEFIPFGAGRRMCPGMHMGTITVEIVLANLLYCFDWKLPDGMEKEDISMEEKSYFFTIPKKIPLTLVPVKHIQQL